MSEQVSLRTMIQDGDRTVFGMAFKGKTIAQAAKLTALAYAEAMSHSPNLRLDLWKDPVIRVEVISNERRDHLDIQLSIDAKWINPREGIDEKGRGEDEPTTA